MIWTLFAKKLIRGAVQAALSAMGAQRLTEWGVTVDPVALTASLYAALEGVRQVLKRKLNWKWL